eukprot:TRINITY_DN13217_c0_g1_i3.p1 TRINITY_DN13217_c0_g1~~TRINITY_DN13217_c0_g1_i3.p1  ORF type:complete len:396 (+),score=47.79 TRINITY_DN13217_c0_g1_i3:119-1306(+)
MEHLAEVVAQLQEQLEQQQTRLQEQYEQQLTRLQKLEERGASCLKLLEDVIAAPPSSTKSSRIPAFRAEVSARYQTGANCVVLSQLFTGDIDNTVAAHICHALLVRPSGYDIHSAENGIMLSAALEDLWDNGHIFFDILGDLNRESMQCRIYISTPYQEQFLHKWDIRKKEATPEYLMLCPINSRENAQPQPYQLKYLHGHKFTITPPPQPAAMLMKMIRGVCHHKDEFPTTNLQRLLKSLKPDDKVGPWMKDLPLPAEAEAIEEARIPENTPDIVHPLPLGWGPGQHRPVWQHPQPYQNQRPIQLPQPQPQPLYPYEGQQTSLQHPGQFPQPLYPCEVQQMALQHFPLLYPGQPLQGFQQPLPYPNPGQPLQGFQQPYPTPLHQFPQQWTSQHL